MTFVWRTLNYFAKSRQRYNIISNIIVTATPRHPWQLTNSAKRNSPSISYNQTANRGTLLQLRITIREILPRIYVETFHIRNTKTVQTSRHGKPNHRYTAMQTATPLISHHSLHSQSRWSTREPLGKHLEIGKNSAESTKRRGSTWPVRNWPPIFGKQRPRPTPNHPLTRR